MLFNAFKLRWLQAHFKEQEDQAALVDLERSYKDDLRTDNEEPVLLLWRHHEQYLRLLQEFKVELPPAERKWPPLPDVRTSFYCLALWLTVRMILDGELSRDAKARTRS